MEVEVEVRVTAGVEAGVAWNVSGEGGGKRWRTNGNHLRARHEVTEAHSKENQDPNDPPAVHEEAADECALPAGRLGHCRDPVLELLFVVRLCKLRCSGQPFAL